MDISIVTGSREPADNVTSFYTFALGIVGGAFLAVGIGDLDAIQGMRGDFLRVYLAVVTAMLGGGIGLFVSRLGDRIADRRATRRRIYTATLHIRQLTYELAELLRLLKPLRTMAPWSNIDLTPAAARATRVGLAATDLPDFDSIVENGRDQFKAMEVRSIFLTMQSAFPKKLDAMEDVRNQIVAMLNPKAIGGIEANVEILKSAVAHFEARVP